VCERLGSYGVVVLLCLVYWKLLSVMTMLGR